MENRTHRLGAVVLMAVFSLFIILIMLSEISLLPETQRNFYIGVKIYFSLTSLVLSYWLWRDYTSVLANTLVGLNMAAYTLHGQMYRPLYYFAFVQLGVALSFVFALPIRIFRPLMIGWMAAYAWVFYATWDQYQAQMQHQTYADIMFAVATIGIICMIAHSYFTQDRLFRSVALARFSRMGYQSSRLVHNLKGLTSAPKIYAQLLQEKLKDHNDPAVVEALTALSMDIGNLEKVVIELNQLSAVKVETGPSNKSLQDVVDSVVVLLGNRLKHVRIENNSKILLHADRSLLGTIFLNLFLNALENFKQRETKNPLIQIESEERGVTIADNGGGFDIKVLKSLGNGQVLSTKSHGSGVGLFMIMDGMQNLGGKAKFKNTEVGAQVTLVFPRSCIINS